MPLGEKGCLNRIGQGTENPACSYGAFNYALFVADILNNVNKAKREFIGMAGQYSVTPVRGMRDFLPADLDKRNAILDTIRQTVKAHGFQEIETPSLEDIHKLQSKQGGENESMLFEVVRRGLDPEKTYQPDDIVDLGLRYDLTLPLSRYYANNQGQLPPVFRAFQTGYVWRAERPQKGRFRQFRQCDIDLIGSSGSAAELEVLNVGCAALRELGLLGDATMFINDRRLLDQLLDSCKIEPEARPGVLIELDKLDKSTPEQVEESIGDISGVSAQAASMLMAAIAELPQAYSKAGVGGDDSAGSDVSVQLNSIAGELSLFDIRFIVAQLEALNKDVTVRFDPSLVRGMGYYTGLIFEVKVPGSTSSICGGGRYDHMIGKFLGKEVPAVGFSLGFERFVDMVDTSSAQRVQGIALGYRTEEDYLAALATRANADSGNSGNASGRAQRIGLVQVPKKPKASFYDSVLAQGYQQIILPEDLTPSFENSVTHAKDLTKDK